MIGKVVMNRQSGMSGQPTVLAVTIRRKAVSRMLQLEMGEQPRMEILRGMRRAERRRSTTDWWNSSAWLHLDITFYNTLISIKIKMSRILLAKPAAEENEKHEDEVCGDAQHRQAVPTGLVS